MVKVMSLKLASSVNRELPAKPDIGPSLPCTVGRSFVADDIQKITKNEERKCLQRSRQGKLYSY